MKRISPLKVISFGSIVIALTAVSAFAGPNLQNGDFSSGLSGWTVEWGDVTDGGGYALFQEDSIHITSTLSQEFTIPVGALDLSFDVVMTAVSGGVSDPFAWPDAFTASLLDPVTYNPLVSNPGYPDFYYLDNTGSLETIAGISGNTVSLDVSTLRGLDALLSFDLLASYDGMSTSVSLDNVNVSVIPAPGALLLGLIGAGAAGLWRRFRRSY